MLFGLRVPWRKDADNEARTELPDAALIERARSGDLEAFNLLVTRHERSVYNVALRYMRSVDLAEDVSQDTFVRAYRALHTFRNDAGEGFRTWLLSIAANRARDVLRARARRPAESMDARLEDDDSGWEPESHTESPLDFASRDELAARLEWALGRLAPDQRLTVVLSDVQGHSYEEVAQITGVAVGTVKSRLNRGRARLREILLADEGGRELLGRHGRLHRGDDRG